MHNFQTIGVFLYFGVGSHICLNCFEGIFVNSRWNLKVQVGVNYDLRFGSKRGIPANIICIENTECKITEHLSQYVLDVILEGECKELGTKQKNINIFFFCWSCKTFLFQEEPESKGSYERVAIFPVECWLAQCALGRCARMTHLRHYYLFSHFIFRQRELQIKLRLIMCGLVILCEGRSSNGSSSAH